MGQIINRPKRPVTRVPMCEACGCPVNEQHTFGRCEQARRELKRTTCGASGHYPCYCGAVTR